MNSRKYSATQRYTKLEWNHLSFLITDAPDKQNLHLYLKECKKHNVTDIVRICEPTYEADDVQAAGIVLHEMFFEDGQPPSKDIILRWLLLVRQRFPTPNRKNKTLYNVQKPCIAVHCVAGLGRAPVLVGIALIDAGLDVLTAVEFIRSHRHGAINAKQLSFLQDFSIKHRRNNCVGCSIL